MFQLHWLLCLVFHKTHACFSPLSPHPLTFPLCVSCTLLDHQQGLAWRSSSWVSFSRMTSKGANQLLSSKPNHERVSVACRTQHPSTLLRPTGSLSNVLGTSQRRCSTSVSLSLSLPAPLSLPRYLHWCALCFPSLSLTPPLLSWAGASWACYPNPTVVAAFVSLTKGPALYTCQGANESNKQGPGKRGGQASAVLLSFTGFLAAALPWKLGNPQSASLMSDDALALMETLEKHTCKKK